MVCTDDPAIEERPPTAGFDTYDGVGVGRYNGVSGFDIVFQLTDDGQPSNDIATILITDPNDGDAVILSVSGYLQSGNHQTHRLTGN
ncbi:MAG: hypothetical protein HKN13_15515 [Rhodothermales bacterium]|nr:hypothetical protein [Rhodothermales bacterium]